MFRFIFIFSTSLFLWSASCQTWMKTKYLDQNYLVKWTANDIKKVVTFRVEVKTSGWFSLGLSSNGKMIKSDVVIGWITPHGKPYFKVSFIYLIICQL